MLTWLDPLLDLINILKICLNDYPDLNLICVTGETHEIKKKTQLNKMESIKINELNF